MSNNNNLHTARKEKNDEFYTQLSDVENELKYYKEFFKGKKVLCNCNDDEWSAFFKYFSKNFEHLGLAKLTCVSYNKDGHGVKYVYNGDLNKNRMVDDWEVERTELNGHGDFSDDECITLLDECDVVVTNPPFSLFRKFITLLMEHKKKFLVIGCQNAITYKEIFPYIKNNELWLGINLAKVFMQPNGTEKKFGNIEWFTNIVHKKRNQPLDLYKKYNAEEYPKYDNYDAINVDKVSDIPMDYNGVMGVPITFLDKYCPTQFEIVGMANNVRYIGDYECLTIINGKPIYNRLLIKKFS